MTTEVILKDEINTAIGRNIDPVELATVYLPRMEYALEVAQTPQETNEIRAQIETVTTYIRRTLPKAVKDRQQQFAFTHESDMLYLKASAKAGAMWEACENRSEHGGDRRSDDFQLENFQLEISAVDAGFKNPRDATTCTRIAQLDEEDWRTYDEETLSNLKQPTLSGAERLWRMLYVFDEDPPELPNGKYRVIYADPPWKYGNTMPDYMGVQDDHYQLMTIEQLCNLPVQNIADDNAVLFMWATSPIIEEAFKVINAWGFKYKASFVWDKVKHVMGHYNSVRHEFLLVCTRGSCQPDVLQLFDSVQSIERSGKHSEKPEEFREIIDTIYTKGNRIELFARDSVDGWEAYGNELTNI